MSSMWTNAKCSEGILFWWLVIIERLECGMAGEFMKQPTPSYSLTSGNNDAIGGITCEYELTKALSNTSYLAEFCNCQVDIVQWISDV